VAPDPRLLERPPWSALTTIHSDFALGTDLARRYPATVAPMAGVREISAASLTALADLMSPGDVVGLFGPEPVPGIGDLVVVAHKHIDQMIFDRQEDSSHTGDTIELTPADVPDMLRLVELTKPGPFSAGAIVLGTYRGIRHAGKLIAMAGERMRFDGFTEISAVCTHPGYRGCGYASTLICALVRQIIARGETPFLHLYSENTIAAALYTNLGFTHRRCLIVTVLRRAN
jgi:ribosomal protein S18 acetylase RimI-like enzyme